MDSTTLSDIKKYAKRELGSASYWPWLVLYTEIPEKFIPGWIPQDYYRFVLLKKFNSDLAMQISESKNFDVHLFPDFALKPVFYKISGNYYTPDFKLLEEKVLSDRLKKTESDLVVKESFGWQGKQVAFFNSAEFKLDQLRNEKDYTVQPAIEQHEKLKKIHPSSVNTIRVNTFLGENGEPVVMNALLRFGNGGSRVDNSSNGGSICFINKDGRCDKWSYNYYSSKSGTRHTDSGVEFSKIKIPGYSRVLQKCLECHKKFPFARVIGWDVAISKDGEPVLIEWNTNCPSLW